MDDYRWSAEREAVVRWLRARAKAFRGLAERDGRLSAPLFAEAATLMAAAEDIEAGEHREAERGG